jgi:hypothetical protein
MMTPSDQIIISVITAFAIAALAYFGFWRQACLLTLKPESPAHSLN